MSDSSERFYYPFPSISHQPFLGQLDRFGVVDFFEFDDLSKFIDLDRLVLTHIRVNKIVSAVEKMRWAAQGSGPKRPPIAVRENEAKKYLFDVVDGNSTTYVLHLLNISPVPVIIQN